MRQPTIILIQITCLLTSCFRREPKKHEKYMRESDCNVYVNEVVSEPIEHGKVEFIDTTKASDCVKKQLANTYILYYNNISVSVLMNHPKDNFKLIEQFIRQYHTDSTDLSCFWKLDSVVHVTIAKKCIKPSDNYANGKYFDKTKINFSQQDNKWVLISKEDLINHYPWQEN